MKGLRITPFHRSLHRPNLFLGTERELGMSVTALAVALPMTSMNIPSFFVGAFLWIVVMRILRKMATIDPMMSYVFRRYNRYSPRYSAHSHPRCEA